MRTQINNKDKKFMSQDKKKRVNLSLDALTLAALQEISDKNAYGSISSTIRIMVKKYGKQETM